MIRINKIIYSKQDMGCFINFSIFFFNFSIFATFFLRFGALKNTGVRDCFVIRINKMICSKQDMGCFIKFSIFTTLFLRFGALKNFTGDCFVI